MSAGICGKRVGFEEIFGSPTPAPSTKRSRCSSYGSPIRSSEFGFGVEDKISILIRMFPSMDREVVESVLNSHGHKIDDAIKSLHALSLGDNSARSDPVVIFSDPESDGNAGKGVVDAQTFDAKPSFIQDGGSVIESCVTHDGSSWVDIFVHEMMRTSDWIDFRNRAMNILESFERNVIARSTASKEQEIASIKEQLQCLLRENQILKRAVTLQHERNLEYDEKLKEVQELKNIISQNQERIQTLELNNYTLKIHLQRAQEASSIPGHFHPDIF